LEEGEDDLAGPNLAFELTNDEHLVDDNQFDKENLKRLNIIVLDEERIRLTILALVDHKIIEPIKNYRY